MDVCRLSILLTSRGIGWMHQNQAKMYAVSPINIINID
jgi:hypothetical protein